MQIVSRAGWEARPPRSRFLITVPSPKLYLHHTASPTGGPARVRAIQDFHMQVRGWSDIAYSFLVSAAGIIYEGRGAGVAGGHTAGQNTVSHAICAMGNYDNDIPSPAMLDSIRQLLAHGHGEGWWPARFTGGHRDAPGAATSCPGAKLYALIPKLNEPLEDDMPTAREIADEIWLNTTIPNQDVSGQRTHMSDAMKRTWAYARKAAIDAAVARAIVEQIAADEPAVNLDPATIATLSAQVVAAVDAELADLIADELADRLRD